MKLMELMGLIPAASIAEQASPGPVAPPWTCQVRGPEILPRTRGAALDLPGTGTGNPAPEPPEKTINSINFIKRLFWVEVVFESPENGLQAELRPLGLPRCRSKSRKMGLLYIRSAN